MSAFFPPYKGLMGFGCFGLPVSSANTLSSSLTSHGLDWGWFIHSFFIFFSVHFMVSCFHLSPLKPFSCLRRPKNKHETLVLKREEKKLRCNISQGEGEWERSYCISAEISLSEWWIRNVWESRYTGLTIPMLIAREYTEREREREKPSPDFSISSAVFVIFVFFCFFDFLYRP